MPATSNEIARIIAAITDRTSTDGSDSAKIAIGDVSDGPLDEIEYTVGGETNTVEGPFEQGQQIIQGEMFHAFAAGIADYLVDKLVPIGTILAFNGTLGNVPAGWAVCDGTSSTPDLRDKFLRGDGSAAGATGGGGSTGAPSSTTTALLGATVTLASSTHTHTQDLPPYYEVIYIIRQE